MLSIRKIIISLFLSMILLVFPGKGQARDLIMCTHMGFEPFVIKKNKSLIGIDIDIVVQVLKNLKQSADIRAYPWNRLLVSLKEGKCDVGFSLFDTEERREYAEYLFTAPIHYSTFSLFVLRNKTFEFNRISDIFGKTIAQNRGFSLTVGLEQAIADGRIKRILFDDANSALSMLESGRIDAILDNEQRFRYYLKKQKKQKRITVLNVPFLPHHPAFMVISKNSDFENLDALKAKIEKELRKLHLDGTILNITTKYLN